MALQHIHIMLLVKYAYNAMSHVSTHRRMIATAHVPTGRPATKLRQNRNPLRPNEAPPEMSHAHTLRVADHLFLLFFYGSGRNWGASDTDGQQSVGRSGNGSREGGPVARTTDPSAMERREQKQQQQAIEHPSPPFPGPTPPPSPPPLTLPATPNHQPSGA